MRTDREDFSQGYDLQGKILRKHPGEKYETYLVAWREYPEELMLREEIEPLTEGERLELLASDVMET